MSKDSLGDGSYLPDVGVCDEGAGELLLQNLGPLFIGYKWEVVFRQIRE